MAETEDANKLSNEMKGAASAAARMAKTLGLTRPSITDFANSAGKLGQAAGSVTKIIEDQVGQYQVLTKSGISFDGSLSKMVQQTTQAGLSIKEMTGLVASNSELLAGFGGTVDGGAQGFLASMRDMRQANNQYGMQLRNIGLTHEEIGEAMLQTQRMAMMSGRREAATDAQIQQATAEYAKDLDLLSKLTGKSNDALKKEQAALQRQGDFRAKTMGMEIGMQKAMQNAASEADASGIGDLFKDMMIRGFPSDDQAQLAGMFSNSMGVMKQMKAAQDAGNTEEYNRLKGTLAAAAIKDKAANQELAILGGTNSATAAVAEAYAKTSEAMIGVQAAYQRGEITAGQLQKEIQDRRIKALQEQKKVGGDAKPGDPVGDNQKVLQAALRGQEAMINAAVAVQAEVTEKVYTEYMGPLFNKLTKRLVGNEQELVDNTAGKAMKLITSDLAPEKKADDGVDAKVVKDTQKNITAGLAGNLPDDQKVLLANLSTEIHTLGGLTERSAEQTKALVDAMNKANQIATGGQVPTIPLPTKQENLPSNQIESLGVGQEGNVPEYNRGTPGLPKALGGFKTFASSTEDFGKATLARLHGNELVMTKAQAAELDAGIMALTTSAHSTFANMLKAVHQPDVMDREIAMLGSAGMDQGNRQGAVNTLRSPETQASAGANMDSMKPMMEEMKTSMMAQAEAMKNALPADMFEKMSTAMEKTASGIGSQLIEQKNMTKVTKNLGNMGNVFSRGGLNI